MLKWNVIFVGTFQEHVELGYFPLDKQPLKIIVSTGYELQKKSGKRVWLLKNPEKPSAVAYSRFVQTNQYKLDEDLLFRETVSSKDESSSQFIFSRLEICMVVYRKPWFWFLDVILPNFLITLNMHK